MASAATHIDRWSMLTVSALPSLYTHYLLAGIWTQLPVNEEVQDIAKVRMMDRWQG